MGIYNGPAATRIALPRREDMDVARDQALASIDVSIPFVAPPGQSLITVNVVGASGNAIYGMYTALLYNGSAAGSDSTPSAFAVNDGPRYAVAISDHGSHYFDHWQDTGDTSSARAIITAGSPIDLV